MVLSPPALLCLDTDGHFLPSCIVLCWACGQNVLTQYEWVQSLNTHRFSLSPSFCLSLSLSHWLMPHYLGKLPAHILPNRSGKIVCLHKCAEGEKKRGGTASIREGTASMTMQSGLRGREIDGRTDREREIHCVLLNVLGIRGCWAPCQ